jgi:formylmethanofuran dehydrogenase subunit E
MDETPASLTQVVAFHGHYCPGVTIGYRAALIALRELGVERAQDEELVALCENDACGVDAVQALTGCTLGKGNLIRTPRILLKMLCVRPTCWSAAAWREIN